MNANIINTDTAEVTPEELALYEELNSPSRKKERVCTAIKAFCLDSLNEETIYQDFIRTLPKTHDLKDIYVGHLNYSMQSWHLCLRINIIDNFSVEYDLNRTQDIVEMSSKMELSMGAKDIHNKTNDLDEIAKFIEEKRSYYNVTKKEG